MSTIETFKQEILRLRRSKQGENLKPHKLVMLLSVIELIDRGVIQENKIYLSPQLINTFESIFLLVKGSHDWCQPGPPFFHLRSSNFWFHKIYRGHEKEYYRLTTTGGGLKLIYRHIEYAYLRDDVFDLLMKPESRREIKEYIASILGLQRIEKYEQ